MRYIPGLISLLLLVLLLHISASQHTVPVKQAQVKPKLDETRNEIVQEDNNDLPNNDDNLTKPEFHDPGQKSPDETDQQEDGKAIAAKVPEKADQKRDELKDDANTHAPTKVPKLAKDDSEGGLNNDANIPIPKAKKVDRDEIVNNAKADADLHEAKVDNVAEDNSDNGLKDDPKAKEVEMENADKGKAGEKKIHQKEELDHRKEGSPVLAQGEAVEHEDVSKNLPNDQSANKKDAAEGLPPKPVQKPNNVVPAPEFGGSKADNPVVQQGIGHRVGDKSPGQINDIDDDDSSSPTVLWFVLFSVVIILTVAIYVHRSGLRAPSALGFEPVPSHNRAEGVPLMTPVEQLVSTALLNLRVPPSAVEKYVQAFHNQRITHVEQLDDSTWAKLSLPSAIELELRRRFEDTGTNKPRSPGLTLHRSNKSESRAAPVLDGDMEFDDWSFDDEEINNTI